MEYRVLGPLEVVDGGGRSVQLGGSRQKTVLASLLLRAGQTVTLERLVDELWEEPPGTAAKTVQVYVSRLRHALPAGAIESRPGGYALVLDGDRLDLRAFEGAAEEGRAALVAGDCEEAARRLREALELWRGPALAGLPSDALRRQAERLEELRLQVLENRIEADLGRGRQREVVPELQALVAEHPFRERPRAQLMLALYRSSRRGDALALYRETRHLLVEELGIEPGEELRALERAILTDDAALDAPAAIEAPERPLEQPATAGTVTLLFTDIEGSTRLVRQLRGRYGEVLAEHQRLLRAVFAAHGGREIDAEGDSFFVAFGSAHQAVLAAVEGQLALHAHRWPDGVQVKVRMGLHTGHAVPAEGGYTGLAVHRAARICAAGHGGQVLVSQATQTLLEDEEENLPFVLRDLGEQRLKDFDRPVRLYQAAADGLPAEFPPLRLEAPLAEAAGAVIRPSLWRRPYVLAAGAVAVAGAIAAIVMALTGADPSLTVAPNEVGVIDPKTNKVSDAVPVGAGPHSVAVGEGAVWVASDDKTLSRVDPQTHMEQAIALQDVPTGIAAGKGAVWVAHRDGTVERIDPRYNQHAGTTRVLGPGASFYPPATSGAVDIGPTGIPAVWVAYSDSTVARIDTRDYAVRRGYASRAPSAIAVSRDAVWVANSEANTVSRLDPTNLETETNAPITVGKGPSAVAVGGGGVWVADRFSNAVSRIDPLTNSSTSIPVGERPGAIAFGYGSVWVANGRSGTVSRIDPKSSRVVATIDVGNTPKGIVVGAGRVWVTVQQP